MNLLLVFLVVLYVLVTLLIGANAGLKSKTSIDFSLAGRGLRLPMVWACSFATWFGAEAVLGIPARFLQSGLSSLVEDPFGAGSCLILVGLLFAKKLYGMNILTIGTFYRRRFGVQVEILCSVTIMLSYLVKFRINLFMHCVHTCFFECRVGLPLK